MMRVVLGLGAALGVLATIHFFERIVTLSMSPSGGLAVLALTGPLGSAAIFTAVCLAAVGVLGYLTKIVNLLKAAQATTVIPAAPVPDLRDPLPPPLGWPWEKAKATIGEVGRSVSDARVQPSRQEPRL